MIRPGLLLFAAVGLLCAGCDEEERNPPGPRPPLDDDSAGGDDDAGDDDIDPLVGAGLGGAIGGACPPNMVLIDGDFCIDRFEAPNTPGGLPLVMYTFVEAVDWCELRGRRLCFDDEWERVCGGPHGLTYPYGDDHEPGLCNDDEVWLLYEQSQLNGWPSSASAPEITSLDELWETAAAVSGTAAAAADHVEWLNQAEPSGSNAACTTGDEVYDMCGNVEEWTRRRDGGSPDFHGNLKGRCWAESRTCQSNITTHGDHFRFYEIGFRCCRDPLP